MNEPLLEVRELSVEHAARGRARVTAVDGVSFEIARGEVLALAGESGSGKSSLARAVVRLVVPKAGSIRLWTRRWPAAIEVTRSRGVELAAVRGAVQLVFQDALASLSPRMSIRSALGEAVALRDCTLARSAVETSVDALLDAVRLPRSIGERAAHELSGGEAQRCAIARALAVEPELLVCDEVLSALDASVQAQVLELLAQLRRERGLALLFITHDLAAARWLADRIAVMQAGRIVESGATERVLSSPAHAATRTLVAAAGL